MTTSRIQHVDKREPMEGIRYKLTSEHTSLTHTEKRSVAVSDRSNVHFMKIQDRMKHRSSREIQENQT